MKISAINRNWYIFYMRIIFIHQNLPGQFRHLIAKYANVGYADIIGVGDRKWVSGNLHKLPQGFKVAVYDMQRDVEHGVGPHLQSIAAAVHRGLIVAQTLLAFKKNGFIPDIVYAHPGWGEALYVKDIFPDVRLVNFCEFYYRSHGQDVNFDPEYPSNFDEVLQLRIRNAPHLLSLDAMDCGISPTHWQRQCFPSSYHSRIAVVHDGVDTEVIRPNPDAKLTLSNGWSVTCADEVITFVNRNLEPCRGFHIFMRALPKLLQERPKAQVVIVGGDEVSYSKPSIQGSYRAQMLAELSQALGANLDRVHFLGKITYDKYLNVLQISTAHVYLTYPFVLSWSMLEAMAAGCVLIGSRTRPVQEVVEHGRNGYLVDFFSPQEIAETVIDVCERKKEMDDIRFSARQTIVDKFDLRRICLPRQMALLEHGLMS